MGADTMRGGAKRPDLVSVLTGESAPSVDWLMDKFGLDLSLVSRLGGHSNPRTHRGKERFPGMTITYALMERLEEIAEESDRARIMLKTKAEKLLTDSSGNVIGVECVNAKGEVIKEYGPVIIATGGFGADFSADSLLNKHRPDLAHLPTTNGEHCTGDGLKMAMGIGADTWTSSGFRFIRLGSCTPTNQTRRSSSSPQKRREVWVGCFSTSRAIVSAMSSAVGTMSRG